MGAGRPDKYDPKYCEEIVEFMKKGKFVEQYAAHIGVSKQCFYRWADKYDEFRTALEEAKNASLAFFLQKGIDSLDRDENGRTKLDTRLFEILMKGAFKFGIDDESSKNAGQVLVIPEGLANLAKKADGN